MPNDFVEHSGIDVLVIGGGLAGTFAAIKARETGAASVVQLDKGCNGKTGCSAFAAGVVRACWQEEDDLDAILKEGVAQAYFLCDQLRLQDHLTEIGPRLQEMDSYGVEFEKRPDGKLDWHYGRAGTKRVMFHGGVQMMEAMKQAAKKRGVTHVDRIMITDILTDDGRIGGAMGFDTRTGQWHVFPAKAVVLATGRCWYKGRLPGHRNVTGDGFVAAYRAGVELVGMERTRNNNMPLDFDLGPGMSMFVGLGGFFANRHGEKFMYKYEPVLKDLAPLFSLNAFFAMEARRGNTPVYLDMTHLEEDKVSRIKRMLPLTTLMFNSIGALKGDRFVKKIEIAPAAIQCEGGVKVNRNYEASMPGLYACGDAIVGAGEEVGQSALPGAITSGARAGMQAAAYGLKGDPGRLDRKQVSMSQKNVLEFADRKNGIEPDQVLLSLSEAINPYDVFMLRRQDKLEKALDQVNDIWEHEVPLMAAYDPHYLRMAVEARNMVLVAMMQLQCALYRKESRTNLREDYPLIDNEGFLKWLIVRKSRSGAADATFEINTDEIPVQRYPVKPALAKVVHPRWEVARQLGIVRVENGWVEWTNSPASHR